MTVTGSREAQALVRDWLSAHGAVLEPLMAADLVSRVAALSPDPAGVTLTLEEIARIVDPYFRDPLSLSLNKRRTDQALEKATAILSLIQKSVQPAHPPFNKGNE